MHKEIQLQINKIVAFIIVSLVLFLFLYYVPLGDGLIFKDLCLYKRFLGIECWNCGMTRAFSSVVHGNFEAAINYNWKVIIVFPLIIGIYLNFWYKILIKNNLKKEV